MADAAAPAPYVIPPLGPTDYLKTDDFSQVNWENQIVLTAGLEPKVSYIVPKEYVVEECKALQAMLEAHDEEEKKQGLVLAEIDGETLEHVMDFMREHDERPMRPIQTPMKREWASYVGEWDKAFVTQRLVNPTNMVDNLRLFKVLNAAIFLELESLTQLTSCFVAEMLSGKTLIQFRELLHVTERHPKEVEEEMAKEFKELFPDKAHLFELPPRDDE